MQPWCTCGCIGAFAKLAFFPSGQPLKYTVMEAYNDPMATTSGNILLLNWYTPSSKWCRAGVLWEPTLTEIPFGCTCNFWQDTLAKSFIWNHFHQDVMFVEFLLVMCHTIFSTTGYCTFRTSFPTKMTEMTIAAGCLRGNKIPIDCVHESEPPR